jgi:DNA-binding transcriptional LysR family regulator
MFDARLLTVFREVATRGSFSEAAAALSFTQPAVSQQIARLEREMGTKLLARNARGVSLTPAGEVLLRHAEAMLQQLRQAEAEVQAVAGVERPQLRVGAFASAAASIMPPALAELRSAHPAAAVTMRVTEMPESLDALQTGELDLSVIIDAVRTPLDLPSGLEVTDLFEDPFLAALPYSHPLAGRGAVALAELREEEWMVTGVANSCPDTTIVLEACRDAGFTPQASFSSDDYAAIQGMVASGMGVAIIPSLALGNAREDIAIRPLRGTTPTRRVRAAIAADRPSALADALLEILRASGRDRRWAGRQLAAVA